MRILFLGILSFSEEYAEKKEKKKKPNFFFSSRVVIVLPFLVALFIVDHILGCTISMNYTIAV